MENIKPVDKSNETKKPKNFVVYLLISFSLEKNKDEANDEINFQEKNAKIICLEKNDKEKIYEYKVIIEYTLENPKKNKQHKLEFKIGEKDYAINFVYINIHFIYELELYNVDKFYKFEKKQNQSMNYSEKFNLFYNSLKKLEQQSLYDDLYNDTIDLYSHYPKFDFLINIFVKVYQNKNICPKLLGEFKKFNDEIKNNIKDKHFSYINFEQYLIDYKTIFGEISENIESIISKNSYNPSYFYGLALCYLNNYDYEIFKKLLEKLSIDSKSTLFEILITYNHFFKNKIILDDKLMIDFVGFAAERNKENIMNFIDKGLFYLDNVNIYLSAINSNKEKIIQIKDFKTIIVPNFESYSNINLKRFHKDFNDILTFSENEQKLLIIFPNYFWEGFLKIYENATQENIINCKILRENFLNYYNVLKNYCRVNSIKAEAEKYYNNDVFAYILDNSIKFYLEEKKNLQNKEIVKLVMEYDPYYFPETKTHNNKRNPEIFQKLNFNEIDEDFKQFYKNYNFEIVFKEKLESYISLLISKINNIFHFGIILDIINIDNIGDKLKTFTELMENKYESSMKKPGFIEESTDKGENNKVITALFKLFKFFHEQSNLESVKRKINLLQNENMKIDLYIRLYKINDTDIKKYVEDKFIKNLNPNNLVHLIKFMKSLNTEEDNLKIIERLRDKYPVTEEIFISKEEDISIELLILLKENDLLIKNEKNFYYESIKKEFENIFLNIIDTKNITIKQLDSFLSPEEEYVIKKLTLLKNITEQIFNPKDKYNELKNLLTNIKTSNESLIEIKSALEKYHKETYKESIKKINEFIDIINNGKIEEYNQNAINLIISEFKEKCNNINNVKDSHIFNLLYKHVNEKDSEKRFDKTFQNFEKVLYIKEDNEGEKDLEAEELLNTIKKELTENQIQEEINTFIKKLGKVSERYVITIEANKHQKNINSIFYFYSNYSKNDENWNEIFSSKYKDIAKNDAQTLYIYLKELKQNEIYDYSNQESYINFFLDLYELKEAYNFLLNNTPENIENLYNKIEPNNQKIKIKDIDDTYNCVGFFQEIKKKETNMEIFKYIKEIDSEYLERFHNFSCVYPSIIELNQNNELSFLLYEEIGDITKDSKIKFSQDKQMFTYVDSKGIEKDDLTLAKLKNLYNKIHIPPKENKAKKNLEENSEKYEEKYKTLDNYKTLVNHIEIIQDYMDVLRTKGSSLPISITIIVKNSNIEYFLYSEKSSFDKIQNYLFNVKNYTITKIEEIYKEKANLRFIYGKQFENLMNNNKNDKDGIKPFLRYIINETDNEKDINPGYFSKGEQTKNYVDQYKLYTDNSFDDISKYISTVFKNNNTSYEELYSKILFKKRNTFKGIYLYHSKSPKQHLDSNSKNSGFDSLDDEANSMEGDILNIFLEYIGILPIAQNILISNKETSYEEIQAFFYRAILCRFNTVFIVEMNNSFSDYQRKIMNNIIDKLLIYKNKLFNEEENKNVEKIKTSEYMDSCLIFIYNDECDDLFLNEIQKLSPPYFPYIEKRHRLNSTMNYSSDNENEIDYIKSNPNNFIYENTHIIASEICGLGKSTKIRSDIKKKNKIYIYFPLGGNLSKKTIYNKLDEIITKTKTKTKNAFKDIAIHLDLYESKETSILNEFLFSFLITKFYSNNEDIIYIPKNIEIYIEIPNCFKDFKSDYNILNTFNTNTIKFERDDIPELNLPSKKKVLIKNMLGFTSDEKTYKYIIKMMNTPKKDDKNKKDQLTSEKKNDEYKIFSYHQINIFINLFISQYNKFNGSKLFFRKKIQDEEGKNIKIDVTDECIKQFARGTKYFFEGAYAQLLTDQSEKLKNLDYKEQELYYIKKLSTIYDDDLKKNQYDIPLIFIVKEKKEFFELDLSEENLKKFEKTEDYLNILKTILSLDAEVEDKKDNKKKTLMSIVNEDNYVITQDNFRKMILILYRIIANIPVILMGETGCGKTSLIKKLNQLLNHGEETVKIINIDPSYDDEKLIGRMKEINNDAEVFGDKNLWLFLDELNTCDSLALITEIFTNRSFSGIKLKDNIRIIGACNPYRIKEKGHQKVGLHHPNENKDLIYSVNLLPQSLLYYVFNFGSINTEDEKKYISSIISNIFTEEESILKEKTKNIISKCHEYLKNTFDYSVVSLRELSRFTKMCEFFKNTYYVKKNQFLGKNNNEELNKIKSIILSIYICYYMRLTDQKSNFENELQPIILELVNYKNNNKNINEEKGNLLSKINEPLKSDLVEQMKENDFKNFSDILTLEEKFVLNEINLEKGIGLNKLLRENIFLLFISLVTQIPLIIVGKPGSGKSLSAHLIFKSMRGEFSKSKFFVNFPKIIQSYFQGSDSTIPEDVENIFKAAKDKLKTLDKEKNISMILFDEMGLAEKAKTNPLKALHSRLEYNGNKDKVSFVGISNWSLDAAKVNRCLLLSVPDLEDRTDDLIETSKSIAKSINENIGNNEIFNSVLPLDYKKYKDALKELKNYIVYKQFLVEEFNNKIKPKLKKNFEKFFGSKNLKYENEIKFEEIMAVKKPLADIIKKELNIKDYPSWMKEDFNVVFSDENFKKLYKKESTIDVDFHGNRDFYYLIKGIARDLNNIANTKNLVTMIIEKYIERNFGGIEFEIERKEYYDFKPFKLIKEIRANIAEKKEKISSVVLFKIVHNLVINDIYNDKENKPIIENVKKYDILENIIDNLNDRNSRYILLEIKPAIAPLIKQSISKKLNKNEEKIKFYEGSPFINDNDNEYQFKMLNILQNHTSNGDIIIYQNLEQIYAYLYDLFNMNYIVNNEKNYARISHGNYSEQLVYIHDNFKCIVMEDKKYINMVDPPFLNRFEKFMISIDKLLSPAKKKFFEEIWDNGINLTEIIENVEKIFDINYDLKNLLIGCKKQDIQGLIFNLSQNNDDSKNEKIEDKEEIKRQIYDKISKLLPQDIIINLPDTNLLKISYFKNRHFSKLIDYLEICEKKDYKISIIYTFSFSDFSIDGVELSSSHMISEIQSEKMLFNLINDKIKINKSKKNNKKYILLQFDVSQSNKLNFVVSFINNNFSDEEYKNYKFICIIHVRRNFKEKNFDYNKKIKIVKNEQKPLRISNIFDVYPNVNQIFIDNLIGENITLDNILNRPIKNTLEESNDLEEIFFKVLKSFIFKNEPNNKNSSLKADLNGKDYEKLSKDIEETFKYNEKAFMRNILEKAKSFVKGFGKDLIEKIYKDEYIKK